jgi:SulP family sulfate permease
LQRSFIDELKELNGELRSRRIRLAMMAVHRPVMEAFERSGFINEIGTECLIDSSCLMEHKGGAITRLFSGLDHDHCRNACPHALFHECRTVK